MKKQYSSLGTASSIQEYFNETVQYNSYNCQRTLWKVYILELQSTDTTVYAPEISCWTDKGYIFEYRIHR